MSTQPVLYTRRVVVGMGLLGLLASANGCDSGVSQSAIEEVKDGSKGKEEADARKKAFGTTGLPKSQKPKR